MLNKYSEVLIKRTDHSCCKIVFQKLIRRCQIHFFRNQNFIIKLAVCSKLFTVTISLHHLESFLLKCDTENGEIWHQKSKNITALPFSGYRWSKSHCIIWYFTAYKFWQNCQLQKCASLGCPAWKSVQINI